MYTTNLQRHSENLCETIRILAEIDRSATISSSDLTRTIRVADTVIHFELIQAYDEGGMGKGCMCMLATESKSGCVLLMASGTSGYASLSDAINRLEGESERVGYNLLAIIRFSQLLQGRQRDTSIAGDSMVHISEVIMQMFVATAKGTIIWAKDGRRYTAEVEGEWISIETVPLEGRHELHPHFAYDLGLPGFSALLCAGTPAYFVVTDLLSLIDDDLSTSREIGLRSVEQLCNRLIEKATSI